MVFYSPTLENSGWFILGFTTLYSKNCHLKKDNEYKSCGILAVPYFRTTPNLLMFANMTRLKISQLTKLVDVGFADSQGHGS